MEDNFIDPPEKLFCNEIIKCSNSQNLPKSTSKYTVALFGWNSDEGTKINGGRVGGEKAPTAFRESLKKSQLVPIKNQKDLLIVDFGNNKEDTEDITLPEAHLRLEKRVYEFLQIKNCTPFIIGGSNDQSYPNGAALLTTHPNDKIAIINIDAHFDVRGLKEGKAHSGSPFRQCCLHQNFSKNKSILVEFASQGAQTSQNHCTFVKENGGFVYWLEKDIRRFKIDKENKKFKTQAGQLMEKVLNMLSDELKCQKIFFSFDVDSIHSQFCPGVSAPSVIGGLTDEEARELAYLAGYHKNVALMDMSEFNPSVDSERTGMLLAGLFYYFCKGLSKRK